MDGERYVSLRQHGSGMAAGHGMRMRSSSARAWPRATGCDGPRLTEKTVTEYFAQLDDAGVDADVVVNGRREDVAVIVPEYRHHPHTLSYIIYTNRFIRVHRWARMLAEAAYEAAPSGAVPEQKDGPA